ncbi:MAG: hypothetical protein CMQ24_02875 [Gammaproteobacteria bacterium]|nr:hypothetical protein [Gammaproteobacteria bacterium]
MAEWQILEPDVDTVLGNCADPFQALAAGTIPGIVVRNAYDAASCQTVIKRFVEDDLIPDPARPDTILDGDYQTVGHFRSDDGANRPLRIDIGTSLVNKTRLNADFEDPNRNREAFLEHSEGTYALFERLFDGLDDPIACLYDTLRRLACGRIVQPAEEPDGRRYGPAIFRVHYAGQTYAPHINHVRRYDKLTEFAVTRFEYQFAGLICFQNPAATSDSPHATIHDCDWDEGIEERIQAGTYRSYAAQQGVREARIVVEPGDFYLFNSGLIHEVGPVTGDDARIVLATFIGYSPGDREVFVWA